MLGEDPAAGEFAARRRLGYLPENVSFNAALTGAGDAGLLRAAEEPAGCRCPRLLDRVGLGAAASRRLGTYSKGMRQRLGLAQALLGRPRVLLLDEPTTGLDPALRLDFYEILDELRDDGATVLLSSHALNELEDRAERVIIMNRGRMVADGSHRRSAPSRAASRRIRCKAADGNAEILSNKLAAAAVCRRVNGHTIEIDAMPERKIELLRLAADLPVIDVDVVPPTLDELYAHFLRGGGAAMTNMLFIAGKEIQEGLRNRWVLATTLLLAALALTLTLLGSAPTGNVGVRRSTS